MIRRPRILRETDDWLVFDKPAGMHSVALRGGDGNSVEAWLRETFSWAKGLPEAGLAHRLDCETSGCLLVARNEPAQERLREAIRSGRGVEKMYLALASGRVRSGRLTLYFSSRYRRSRKATVRRAGSPEERGRCEWRIIRPVTIGIQGVQADPETADAHAVSPGKPVSGSPRPVKGVGVPAMCEATLLEVSLLGPGRRHQIRAGLAHLGHPLLGDALYGGPGWEVGLGLHARELVIDGISVECPPPPGWPPLG